MAYLKEDGSLDIERINNLPFEDFLDELRRMTHHQRMEYEHILTINEGDTTIKIRKSNLSCNDALKKGIIVDAKDYLKKMQERHANK